MSGHGFGGIAGLGLESNDYGESGVALFEKPDIEVALQNGKNVEINAISNIDNTGK